MNKIFTDRAWKEYIYWFEQDKKMLKRIIAILKDIDRTPFDGIGKPEALRGDLSGFWSRRIDDKHRLVYRINDNAIEIVQCKGHYDDK